MTYIKIHDARTQRSTRTHDGKPTTKYSPYETGVIDGSHRQVMAVIADSAGFDGLGFDASVGSNDDSWHVLNTFKDGRYVDTLAVGGALDGEHAINVAKAQFDHLGANTCVLIEGSSAQFDSLVDVGVTWSIDAISKLMTNRSQDKPFLPMITASELNQESNRVCFDSVEWNDDAGLLSHGGAGSRLHLDMVRADTHHELISPFDLNSELDRMGATAFDEATFDALMAKESMLPQLANRLYRAMAIEGGAPKNVPVDADGKKIFPKTEKPFVTEVTQTQPFKRLGLMNIAFVFDLSDGQTISIWFHNPDKTPNKLLPSDIMISWKWLLNKRDVTAVLSPKQGDNVQLPALAKRMMLIASKNSKRFQATQARVARDAQDLLDAQALIDTKNATIDQLNTDIAELNKSIDAAMKAPKVNDTLPTATGAQDLNTTSDTMPNKDNQLNELYELQKLAPKKGEAITSDDPNAISKLEAKLKYLEANAKMMRDTNKYVRKGDDAALIKMGFKDKTIQALKEPDYAGRTGFVDYQMTNNNGEIGRVKKRLKALYSERDDAMANEADEAVTTGANDTGVNDTVDAKEIDDVVTELTTQWGTNNDIWNRSIAYVQNLTDDQFNRLTDALTDANYHGENIIVFAKRTGNAEYVAEAIAINQAHIEEGHMTAELRARRDTLTKKIDDALDASGDTVTTAANQEAEPMTTDTPVVTDEIAADTSLQDRINEIQAIIEADDFSAEDVDAQELEDLMTQAEGDAALDAQLDTILAVYQSKLVAISMAALAAMTGGA